jgi:hypothetical protein
VREYLQARILEGLQNAGAMIHLAFQGGTALRFLYAIPRYSEDLGFALEKPGVSYDFRAYLLAIQEGFVKEGYQIGQNPTSRFFKSLDADGLGRFHPGSRKLAGYPVPAAERYRLEEKRIGCETIS